MNFKKTISLSLCVLTLFLTGCTSSAAKTIKVATLEETAPYDYITENTLTGIDVDILKKAFPKNSAKYCAHMQKKTTA